MAEAKVTKRLLCTIPTSNKCYFLDSGTTILVIGKWNGANGMQKSVAPFEISMKPLMLRSATRDHLEIWREQAGIEKSEKGCPLLRSLSVTSCPSLFFTYSDTLTDS